MRIVIRMTEMRRNRSCLTNHVVHSTHWLRPIIFMDSRILVSFSITSSCGGYVWLCASIGVGTYLDEDGCCVHKRHDYQKRQHEIDVREECVLTIAWVGKLLRKIEYNEVGKTGRRGNEDTTPTLTHIYSHTTPTHLHSYTTPTYPHSHTTPTHPTTHTPCLPTHSTHKPHLHIPTHTPHLHINTHISPLTHAQLP